MRTCFFHRVWQDSFLVLDVNYIHVKTDTRTREQILARRFAHNEKLSFWRVYCIQHVIMGIHKTLLCVAKIIVCDVMRDVSSRLHIYNWYKYIVCAVFISLLCRIILHCCCSLLSRAWDRGLNIALAFLCKFVKLKLFFLQCSPLQTRHTCQVDLYLVWVDFPNQYSSYTACSFTILQICKYKIIVYYIQSVLILLYDY